MLKLCSSREFSPPAQAGQLCKFRGYNLGPRVTPRYMSKMPTTSVTGTLAKTVRSGRLVTTKVACALLKGVDVRRLGESVVTN
jgi:hypothetical protein